MASLEEFAADYQGAAAAPNSGKKAKRAISARPSGTGTLEDFASQYQTTSALPIKPEEPSTLSHVLPALGDVGRQWGGYFREQIPAAGREIREVMGPKTYGQRQFERTTGREPVLGQERGPKTAHEYISQADPVPWLLAVGENLMRMPVALGRAGKQILHPGDPGQLTESVIANAPFLLPGMRRLPAKFPEPKMLPGQVGTRALPPGAYEAPGTVEGGHTFVRPGGFQKMLPESTRSVRPAAEEPPVIAGRKRLIPDEDLTIPRPVEEPPRPVPTQSEVAQRRAGLDPTEPSDRPIEIVDRFGRTIFVPKRTETPVQGPPEPPPQPGPTPTEVERAYRRSGMKPPAPRLEEPPAPPVKPPELSPKPMAEIPRGQSPEEPPPVAGQRAPQPKPPKPEAPRERPVRAGANPEFAVERERWNQRLAEINPGTVNLADPDEVYAYIRGLGRVRATPDHPDIPWFFKSRKGKPFDEMVQEIADAQGKPARDVENQIAQTMERYHQLREAKRAKGIERPGAPKGDAPPSMEEWEERGRKDPDSMYPEWLRGVVPPIPLPDLPEDEQNTTKGRMYRALQMVGLAAPMIGMAAGMRGRGAGATRIHQRALENAKNELAALEPGPSHERTRLTNEIAELQRQIGRIEETPPTVAKLETPDAVKNLESEGPRFPPVTGKVTPRYEQTEFGEQGLIEGTPGRQIPSGPIGTERPQRPIDDLPLFGQEKAAREQAAEKAQGGLFDRPTEERPGKPGGSVDRPTDDLPGAPGADPGSPASLPDVLTDETGAISLGRMVDAWKKNAKKVRQMFPMEGEVRKRVPNSPVISATESRDAFLAEWMEKFEKTPVWKALDKMKPAELLDLEERMVQGFKAGTVSRLGAGPGVPSEVQGYLRFRDNQIGMREQPARRYFGLDPIPEQPGPYLPRVTDKEARESVSLGGGKLGLGRDLATTVGTHQRERVFETAREGERAGIEYADPRNAILLREWASARLQATHQLFQRLERQGVLFRDKAAAQAANARIPTRTGGPWRVEDAPGGEWWARTEEEAKFLEQNLTEPGRGSQFFNSFVHYANTFIRTPGLFNPLPHLTKNMGFKYLIAAGPLDSAKLAAKAVEYARGSNPTRLAEFREAMPFSKTARTAEDVLHTNLREGPIRDTLKAIGRAATFPSRVFSQKAVFKYGDPAMRYGLFDHYRHQGMDVYEAGNHAWQDLVRYGTRAFVTDEWKSIPMNFFTPWRYGTVVSLLKQVRYHPVRTALTVGAIEYLREARYRHTGRWTHLPVDYVEKPIALLLQERDPWNLPAVIGTMAAFGPGGDFTASNLRDMLATFETGSGRGIQDPDTRRRLRNMFWAVSQAYEIPLEVKAGIQSGDPEHYLNAFMSAVFAEHSALSSKPRRLMEGLPEWLPGMRRSGIVRASEDEQQRRREVRERSQTRRAEHPRKSVEEVVRGRGY